MKYDRPYFTGITLLQKDSGTEISGAIRNFWKPHETPQVPHSLFDPQHQKRYKGINYSIHFILEVDCHFKIKLKSTYSHDVLTVIPIN